MSISVANATIRISATSEEVGKGVDAAIGHINRLVGAAAGLFGSIKIGGFLTEATQKYEAAQLSFEVMLKSAEKAKQLMADIISYEKDTPVRFTEVANGIRRLLVARFDLEDVPSVFRIITDAAAASGDSIAAMTERIARSLGGMNARGYITGEEIREMAHANVAALKYISEELSRVENKTITTGEVQRRIHDKQISASVAVRAILAGMEKDFGGLGKRRGNETFEGLFSTIVSQAEVAGTKLVLSIDKAFGIKQSMREFRDWLIELPQRMSDIGDRIRSSLEVQGALKIAEVAVRSIGTAFEVAGTAARAFLASFGVSGTQLKNMEIDAAKLRGIMLDFFHVVTIAAEVFAHGLSAIIGVFKTVALVAWAATNAIATFFATITQNKGALERAEADRQAGRKLAESILADFDPNTLKGRLTAVDDMFNKLRAAPRMEKWIEGVRDVGVAMGDSLQEQVAHFNRGAHELKLAAKLDWSGIEKDIEDMVKELDNSLKTPLGKLKDELELFTINAQQLTDQEFNAGIVDILMRNGGKDLKKIEQGDPRVSEAIFAGSLEARRLQIAAIQPTQQDTVPDLLQQINRESQKQLKVQQELLKQAQRNGLVIVPGN